MWYRGTEREIRGKALCDIGGTARVGVGYLDIAATVSAPLGSLSGDHLGWRGAFFLVVPVALLALVWQWISVPSLPAGRSEGPTNVLRLLTRREVALGAWGFFATAAPVGWGTWLSRTLSDDAEPGGGLQVAIIQLAITAGAAIGGLLFDAVGWWSPFTLGAVGCAAPRCSPLRPGAQSGK